MRILGISCYFHDAAAALVEDGRVLAAVQEERLSRQRGGAAFPLRALNACLQAAGLTVGDVDAVVFHEKPFLKFARVIQTCVRTWPWSLGNVLATLPPWLEDHLIPGLVLTRETGYERRTLFVKHHYSHAASAFFLSPFEEAAVLTADGVGEMATATWGRGAGARLTICQELRFPHSIGLVYSAVTEFLGFPRHGGEDCVTALAARGTPALLDRLRSVLHQEEDGSLRVDDRYFSYGAGSRLFGRPFVKVFGAPRGSDEPLTQNHLDLAASVQALLEEVLIRQARHIHERTGLDCLCLAGGVAQNGTACARILEETGFRHLFVPPAPGNDGAALGAALASWCAHSGSRPRGLETAALGPAPSAPLVRRLLTNAHLAFSEIAAEELAGTVAQRVNDQGAVAWVQGRLEFAHRALGTRAILVDPRSPDAVARLAGQCGWEVPGARAGVLVAEEAVERLTGDSGPSPYQFVAPRIRPEARPQVCGVLGADGRVPLQTVARTASPALWDLLQAFGRLTGLPALAVLPLQHGGDPLAASAEEAIATGRAAGVDSLVIDNLLVDLTGRGTPVAAPHSSVLE